MSETKAVAVLLWLYELGRKGPLMKLGINGLWWVAAIFLCLMNLSLALLALQGDFDLFSQTNPQAVLIAPFLLILASVLFGWLIASRYDASRLQGALEKNKHPGNHDSDRLRHRRMVVDRRRAS